MSPVEERMRKLLVEHLSLQSGEGLQLDAKLTDDLGADSLDIVELVMTFEEEWGIRIEDHESNALDTVGGCVELVERKLAEKA